jgi:tetrahydromethanopterin S-methyltransferase subunit B
MKASKYATYILAPMSDAERIAELEEAISANDELMQKLYERIKELEQICGQLISAVSYSSYDELVAKAKSLLQKQ